MNVEGRIAGRECISYSEPAIRSLRSGSGTPFSNAGHRCRWVWADKYHAMGYVSNVSATNLHLLEGREASQPSLLGTPIGRLRAIAFSEGCSYLLLLGVAMPLKYFLGVPLAVRIVGSIHGGLFLVFCAALLHVIIVERWSLLRGLVVFASSLVPCGTFVVDPSLRREQAARRNPLAPGSEISKTAS